MNRQVDERMLAERVHHMVVERHGGVDVGLAGAVKVQAEFDVRFAGLADDVRGTRHDVLLGP